MKQLAFAEGLSLPIDAVRQSKRCAGCGQPFPRAGETTRQWAAKHRCATCRVEELKARIREGSVEDANGCWIWQLSTKNGYGQISVCDQTMYTHQLAYALFIGPIPGGNEVCHTCDVRRCNNPEHLFAGTHLENIQDMLSKGRGSKPPTHRGESHPMATLNDAQVREIRYQRDQGVAQREVARRFGCSQSTVWRIAHNYVRMSA